MLFNPDLALLPIYSRRFLSCLAFPDLFFFSPACNTLPYCNSFHFRCPVIAHSTLFSLYVVCPILHSATLSSTFPCVLNHPGPSVSSLDFLGILYFALPALYFPVCSAFHILSLALSPSVSVTSVSHLPVSVCPSLSSPVNAPIFILMVSFKRLLCSCGASPKSG